MVPPPPPISSRPKEKVVEIEKLLPLFSRQPARSSCSPPPTTTHNKNDGSNDDVKRRQWQQQNKSTDGERKPLEVHQSDSDSIDDGDDDDVPLSTLLVATPFVKASDMLSADDFKKLPPKRQRPNKRKTYKEDQGGGIVSRPSIEPNMEKEAKRQRSRSEVCEGNCSNNPNVQLDDNTNSAAVTETVNPVDPQIATADDDKEEKKITARVSLSPPPKSNSKPCRRFFSQSSMDYVAPSPRLGSHNILSRLLDRTTHGCLVHKTTGFGGLTNQLYHRKRNFQRDLASVDASKKGPTWMVSPRWRSPSWVSLASPMEYSNKTNKSVEHFAWDNIGVLLAVACDISISIYDWDMTRAADLQGRRDRSRQCRDSQWKIEPVLQFRAPCPVTKLLWNRFHPDELVVGLRGGKVNIFNIDRVAQWISRDPTHQYQSPPARLYRCIDIPKFSGEIKDTLLVDAENVLVSTSNSMLYRYKLTKKSGSFSTQIWRYQAASNVTSMAQIGSNIIVAGTAYGQLCLLDWTKYSKERSFSRELRPKVLRVCIPHESLSAPREDILLGKRMGILELAVQTTTSSCAAGPNHWGRCKISWATQCGWLLSMVLESANSLEACRVVHETPRALHQSADGTIIQTGRKTWSLPQFSVGAHLSNHLMCITDVPRVTKILSHHDKFVLDSQPKVIRSNKRSLSIFWDEGRQSISLPKSIARSPQALIVHPNREWLVVANGTRLHLLTCR